MTQEKLADLLSQRPWRTIEIVLVSGERFRVGHPEHIGLVPGLAMIVREEGRYSFFEPEAVASVDQVRNGARRKG